MESGKERFLGVFLQMYKLHFTDQSLSIDKVTPILMKLKQWKITKEFTCGTITLVPESRSNVLRKQHTRINVQKREAAAYYIAHSPFASWGHLAKGLYQAREDEAIKVFKTQLPKGKGGESKWLC